MATAGESHKVITSNGIELDFSWMYSDNTAKQPPESPTKQFLDVQGINTPTEEKKPIEGKIKGIEGEQAKQLCLQAARKREDHERSLEIYRTYQENTRKSSQLQTEILNGAKSGENVYILFLKAIKAISFMTGNPLFYSQIEENIKTIYGEGLREEAPLQMELQEAKERLKRLNEALERKDASPESKAQIKNAIKEHEARINALKDLMLEDVQQEELPF